MPMLRAETDRRRLIKTAQPRLAQLTASRADGFLGGGLTGLEKESLRGRERAARSRSARTPGVSAPPSPIPTSPPTSPKPSSSSSPPPLAGPRSTLEFLRDLHVHVFECLEAGEILWAASMPCRVGGGEDNVPVARYGSSNVGRMKHVYRVGLSHRYGRVMQAISGVHFNYSLPPALWRPPAGDRRRHRSPCRVSFRSATSPSSGTSSAWDGSCPISSALRPHCAGLFPVPAPAGSSTSMPAPASRPMPPHFA